MTIAAAPGKIILFGEHAVVYGQPAIAIPVHQVHATASIHEIRGGAPGEIDIRAPDINYRGRFPTKGELHPLQKTVAVALEKIQVIDFPPFAITVESTIPIASGLGSGSAVTIAIIRAIADHLNQELSADQQSLLAFEIEKIHHGNPSGVDNTVVAHGRPVYFVRDQLPEPFEVGATLDIVIGVSSQPSPTARAVDRVRLNLENDRYRVESLLDAIGRTVDSARAAIGKGDIKDLGPLLNHNQALLEGLGVSTTELEFLIGTARGAGALGAKLSGAGMGGNMIALVEIDQAFRVTEALQRAGATRVIKTEVLP